MEFCFTVCAGMRKIPKEKFKVYIQLQYEIKERKEIIMLKKIFSVILAVSIVAGSMSAPQTVHAQTLEKAGENQQKMAVQTINRAAKEGKSIKIKLNFTKITLKKGKTKILKVKGTVKKVTWSSSDKSVATVNQKGKVTAKKAGTAKIKAKIGKVSVVCRVTVNQTLTKKQTEKAVNNYVKQKKTAYFHLSYEGKKGSYYTFLVTFKVAGKEAWARYYVNYKNGKSYIGAIYTEGDEGNPSESKTYIFSAYKYVK